VRGAATINDGPLPATGNGIFFGLTAITPNVKVMPKEEFCARVLGSLCDAAVLGCDELCRLVSYDDLSLGTLRRIADFFGTPLSGDQGVIEGSTEMYSKDVAASRVYVDDRAWKQQAATESIRNACSRWASMSHELLMHRVSAL
jgi:hypothetical protein